MIILCGNYVTVFICVLLVKLDHSYTRKCSEADNSNVPVVTEEESALGVFTHAGGHLTGWPQIWKTWSTQGFL